MVHSDGGDYTDIRTNRIRCIQPSAEAGLPDNEITLFLRKDLCRHGKKKLKIRRMGKASVLSGSRKQIVHRGFDLFEGLRKLFVGNILSVYGNALVHSHQMR